MYTLTKHDEQLRTRGKCRKHSSASRVFYISRVYSNVRSVFTLYSLKNGFMTYHSARNYLKKKLGETNGNKAFVYKYVNNKNRCVSKQWIYTPCKKIYPSFRSSFLLQLESLESMFKFLRILAWRTGVKREGISLPNFSGRIHPEDLRFTVLRVR